MSDIDITIETSQLYTMYALTVLLTYKLFVKLRMLSKCAEMTLMQQHANKL